MTILKERLDALRYPESCKRYSEWCDEYIEETLEDLNKLYPGDFEKTTENGFEGIKSVKTGWVFCRGIVCDWAVWSPNGDPHVFDTHVKALLFYLARIGIQP